MNPKVLKQRAAARPGTPNGGGRLQAFASELRASTVQRDGKEKVRLEGYASMVERAYEMFDVFGEYKEVVSRDAFRGTLSASPDVAFLVNHKGVTMARTTNGTLELSADPTGLRSVSYLNPERQDVRDLVAAIRDGDITEMSFAFLIEDGVWSDDFSEFRINRVNLDRGDVSAVNYGANPFTSIAARSSEILSELDHLPAGAQRAAAARLARAMSDVTDPAQMLASADAAMDQAIDLFTGVDRTTLPPEVAQGIDLVIGAGDIIDDCMDALGIPDPDEGDGEEAARAAAGKRSMDAVAEQLEDRVDEPERVGAPVEQVERSINPGGRSVALIETLLEI